MFVSIKSMHLVCQSFCNTLVYRLNLREFRLQKSIITLKSLINTKFNKIYYACLKYYLGDWGELKLNFCVNCNSRLVTAFFSFLKLISTDMVSMLHVEQLFINLDGISSRKYNPPPKASPPPFEFLSNLYGCKIPLI